jgi:hypothetical protein
MFPGSSIILSLSFFHKNVALKQSARFSRKNRPRSAALQRAGAGGTPSSSRQVERSGTQAGIQYKMINSILS